MGERLLQKYDAFEGYLLMRQWLNLFGFGSDKLEKEVLQECIDVTETHMNGLCQEEFMTIKGLFREDYDLEIIHSAIAKVIQAIALERPDFFQNKKNVPIMLVRSYVMNRIIHDGEFTDIPIYDLDSWFNNKGLIN